MSIPISGNSNDLPLLASQGTMLDSSPQIIERAIKGNSWDAQAIDILDQWDIRLEEKMPNNQVQEALDKFGKKIESLVQQSAELTRWIDQNDAKEWYKQLSHFVATLPIKAARNILSMTYSILKGAAYAFVHPLKFLNHAAQLLIRFVVMLGKPEFYTKLGTGMIGASLGNLAVMGGMSPPALIGLGLGGAFLLGGLTAGAIKAALADKSDANSVKTYLWNELKTLPEVLLTGFLLGALVGGIQKISSSPHPIETKHFPAQSNVQPDLDLLNLPNAEFNEGFNVNDLFKLINDATKNLTGTDAPTIYVYTDPQTPTSILRMVVNVKG